MLRFICKSPQATALSAMYASQHKLPQILPCDVPLSAPPEQGAQLCQDPEEIQHNFWAASTNADHALGWTDV